MNRLKDPRATPSPTERDALRRLDLVWAVLLFAATLLVYAQVWGFGFANMDDPEYVGNPVVWQGITLRSLKWSLTATVEANWIPLTWISFMLDTNLYGYRPGGYHLTNVLLHAANGVLLFFALAAATRARAKSAVVAALFALHPLHVESVAWISERKDVLSTLFGLLSLLAYVRYATRGNGWRLGTSFLFFVCSLLSKPTLVTLPFVFLLLDYWPLDRFSLVGSVPRAPVRPSSRRGARQSAAVRVDPALSDRRRRLLGLIVEKLPFFLASAAFSAVALLTQSKGGAVMELGRLSFAARATNAIYVYMAYLEKTIFPQNLAAYYPHPREGLSWTAICLAAALLLAISAAAIGGLRRFPFLFVGWFWYLGTLVPTIGLVQIGSQLMADRYTYFPLIGVFIAVTWLVSQFAPFGAVRTRLLSIVGVTSLAVLGAATVVQIGYWADSVRLYQRALDFAPDNAYLQSSLGFALVNRGDVADGLKLLEQSCRLSPPSSKPHFALALALQKLGRINEAAAEYRQTIALDNTDAEAHSNLAVILTGQQRLEEARQQLLEAIRVDPDYEKAYINLGVLSMSTGHFEDAINYSQRALEIDPTLLNCHVTIAMALRAQGRFDEAISRFRYLIQASPDDRPARLEMERTLEMKRRSAAH